MLLKGSQLFSLLLPISHVCSVTDSFRFFSEFEGGTARVQRRSRTADARIKKRKKSNGCGDIWEEVAEKWKGQDEVVKVLKKFNVRY